MATQLTQLKPNRSNLTIMITKRQKIKLSLYGIIKTKSVLLIFSFLVFEVPFDSGIPLYDDPGWPDTTP